MPITLRNKKVEQQIREIGRRTGEGPSAVIARLVAAEQPPPGRVSEEERAARIAWAKDFFENAPPWTAEEAAAAKLIEQEMYDEDGLPKSW